MLFPRDILQQATELVAAAQAAGVKVTAAESCTGGLLAGVITSIDGSSAIIDLGLVTYANDAKVELLGLSRRILDTFGAVSGETAEQMAEGARRQARADIAVSVTGIAGPGGGTPEKPVGLVHFGCACGVNGVRRSVRRFGNLGRDEVRLASVRHALDLMLDAIERRGGGSSLRISG